MPLKIGFISDLHFDHNVGLVPVLEKKLDGMELDCFIIAGDVLAGFTKISALIKRLKKHTPRVFFLPGNHDLWVGVSSRFVSSTKLYMDILRRNTLLSGGDYLGLKPVYMGNIAILGVTGWYENYPLPPVKTSDEKYCIWPEMENPEDVLNWQLILLRNQLEEASKKAEKIFVVTHTLPFMNYLKEEVSQELFGYMGSQKLGDLILKYPKVSYVVSGHIHKPYRIEINSGKLIWEISPFGYPNELGNSQEEVLEKALKVIDF
jgi:Icc-related predicted phosphoesterase